VLKFDKRSFPLKTTRRTFLQSGTIATAAAIAQPRLSPFPAPESSALRKYRFIQIDVFTSRRLEGNPLAVFPDARGLSDDEMQAIARETSLQETTFVFRRDPAIEREKGIKVRIFTPEQENPFGGHPTLGTAMVLRNLQAAPNRSAANGPNLHYEKSEISLDLKVGKIPVTFRTDDTGLFFGEMHQVDPVFGSTHDRATVAALAGLKLEDIHDGAPIQTVSTGLPFAILLLKSLAALQSLRPNFKRIEEYFSREPALTRFYYITADTQDTKISLRSRGLFGDGPGGEDAATGSAAGCATSWLVRYGLSPSAQPIHILQGVEMKRPSHIFAHATKQGDKVADLRVGGHAIEVLRGEYSL
jgi:trans-2,3-dihydro-3-hydroxyanthranilate isomerase